MRLDKYLKVTRLIKRRTVANEACDADKVVVNGKAARASYDVKVGDIIEINLGQKPLKVKVLSVNEYATKENASDNYEIIDGDYARLIRTDDGSGDEILVAMALLPDETDEGSALLYENMEYTVIDN